MSCVMFALHERHEKTVIKKVKQALLASALSLRSTVKLSSKNTGSESGSGSGRQMSAEDELMGSKTFVSEKDNVHPEYPCPLETIYK